jgi:hypothetical protein
MAIAVSADVRFLFASSLLVSVLASAGCGTSRVITNDPTARIFANGQLIGRGQGEITQRGTSESTSILVRSDDGREQVTIVKREVTGFTLLGALFTYGTCLIFCWEYPDTIMALLPARAPAAAPSEPGAPVDDPWLNPPASWWSGRSATPPAEPVTGR